MDSHLGILLGILLALQFVTLCIVTRHARGWKWTIGGFAIYLAINGAFLWGCAAAGLSPLAVIQLGCFVLWIPLVLLMVSLSGDDKWRTFFIALDYVTYLTAILPISQALALRKLNVIGGGGIFARLSSLSRRMRSFSSSCCRSFRV